MVGYILARCPVLPDHFTLPFIPMARPAGPTSWAATISAPCSGRAITGPSWSGSGT